MGNLKDIIDISAKKGDPDHEVRFTSGKTICCEAFVDSRWVGRYWTPDGRIRFPYEKWDEDAFRIVVDGEELKGWEFISSEELPETERGQRHYAVELENETKPFTVRIHTLLDGTPIMVRYLEITNNSDQSVGLTDIGIWTGQLWPDTSIEHFPEHAKPGNIYTLGHGVGEGQQNEGKFLWKPLPYGTTVFACDLGVCYKAPFFIVRNEAQGEYFICHFAWSANYQIEFDCYPKGDTATNHSGDKFEDGEGRPLPAYAASLQFRVCPKADAALRVISAGETVTTPLVHLGHTEGSLDATVQTMHTHIRNSVLPARRAEHSFLIEYTVPGDQGYTASAFAQEGGGDEEIMLRQIDIAAAQGSEIFILDAGWWDVPGEWYPSKSRYPNGIGVLRDYAHEKGLLFGLYVEIECVRAYSTPDDVPVAKVATEHPDWIGPKYVIDLANPDAAAWVENELSRIYEEYGLDLYRLDFNPYTDPNLLDFVPLGNGRILTGQWLESERDGILENHWWRYYEAFYSICERLRNKFPHVITEQCAAGGGRNDLGVVACFDETYLTDGLAMPSVLINYCGQALGLPPEILLIAQEEGANHMVGCGQLNTTLRMTFSLGTPFTIQGIAPNLEEITPWRMQRCQHYRKIFKEFIRPLLPTCLIYHHAPISANTGFNSSGWFAMEFGAPDRSKGWALMVRIGRSESDTYLLVPRGLDRGRTYKVTFDSTAETAQISGWDLVSHGIAIRIESLMDSELILFEAE